MQKTGIRSSAHYNLPRAPLFKSECNLTKIVIFSVNLTRMVRCWWFSILVTQTGPENVSFWKWFERCWKERKIKSPQFMPKDWNLGKFSGLTTDPNSSSSNAESQVWRYRLRNLNHLSSKFRPCSQCSLKWLKSDFYLFFCPYANCVWSSHDSLNNIDQIFTNETLATWIWGPKSDTYPICSSLIIDKHHYCLS